MRLIMGMLLMAVVVPVLITGCGGSENPITIKKDADKAFQANNYDEAMTLYGRLLDWKGDNPTPKAVLFESSLNLVRCKIFKKDFDGALKSLEKMQTDFGDAMKVKHYGTVIRTFVDQKAIDQSIAALGIVGNLYPEKKDELKPFIEKIKAEGATPEQLKKLKDLGYL